MGSAPAEATVVTSEKAPEDFVLKAAQSDSRRRWLERLVAFGFGTAAPLAGLQTLYLGKEFGGLADGAKLLAYGFAGGAPVDSLNQAVGWMQERTRQ